MFPNASTCLDDLKEVLPLISKLNNKLLNI